MNHAIYYSRKLKTLLIIPNMGNGVKINNHVVSVEPVLFLNNFLFSYEDSFKEIKGSFDV